MAEIDIIQTTPTYCSMQLIKLDPEWEGGDRQVLWYISGDIQEGKYGADIIGVPEDNTGGFVEFDVSPETKYYVTCIVVVKDTQQQLATLNGEFETPSLPVTGDIEVEYCDSRKGQYGIYLAFELSDYVYEDYVLRAVDDYGNVYKRTIASQTLFPDVYIGDRYCRFYDVSIIGTDGTVIELGRFVSASPPGTIKNITASEWTISGSCEVDYSNADCDVSYVEINLHRSKTTNANDFRSVKTIRLDYPFVDYFSFDVTETKNYADYPYYKVTIDTYIVSGVSQGMDIQKDENVSEYTTLPASLKWTWSSTASNAFQNNGETTDLTCTEWNNFVEFVATKTGFTLINAKAYQSDPTIYADKFNSIREAIGTYNTFRVGENSIRDYIEARNDIEGVDDWNMRPNEIVKGQYFIDLARYANGIN